jgi:hypothetical protein
MSGKSGTDIAPKQHLFSTTKSFYALNVTVAGTSKYLTEFS